jgi:putative cardiolipin synthase
MADNIGRLLASHAYQVRIGTEGELEWIEQADSRTTMYRREPGASPWRRVGVKAVALLPIDWLL